MNTEALQQALILMGEGMLGIFVVIALIFVSVKLLTALTAPRPAKGSDRSGGGPDAE